MSQALRAGLGNTNACFEQAFGCGAQQKATSKGGFFTGKRS
jgi:hypothetical protein